MHVIKALASFELRANPRTQHPNARNQTKQIQTKQIQTKQIQTKPNQTKPNLIQSLSNIVFPSFS